MKFLKYIFILLFLGTAHSALASRNATVDEIRAWCEDRTSHNLTVRNMSEAQACAHYGFRSSVAVLTRSSGPVANPADLIVDGVTSTPTSRSAPERSIRPPVRRGAEERPGTPPVYRGAEERPGTPPVYQGAEDRPGNPPVRRGSDGGVCSDSALTAGIPRSGNRTPGFPTSQSAYREYAVGQITSGNIPSHLRELVPIEMGSESSTCQGQRGPVTICVMPEPIAIGGDGNYSYTNLTINDAVQVGRAFDMILPTSYMVDAIDAAASVRVPSRSRPWFCNRAEGGDCTGGEPYRFQQQSTDIRALVQGSSGYQAGALVTGAYKDYALSSRLSREGAGFSNISLYGWNGIQGSRDRIQHGSHHLDYSQVPRFVSQYVEVGGTWRNMSTLLADPGCADILNGGQTIGTSITGAFVNPNAAPAGARPVQGGSQTTVLAEQ